MSAIHGFGVSNYQTPPPSLLDMEQQVRAFELPPNGGIDAKIDPLVSTLNTISTQLASGQVTQNYQAIDYMQCALGNCSAILDQADWSQPLNVIIGHRDPIPFFNALIDHIATGLNQMWAGGSSNGSLDDTFTPRNLSDTNSIMSNAALQAQGECYGRAPGPIVNTYMNLLTTSIAAAMLSYNNLDTPIDSLVQSDQPFYNIANSLSCLCGDWQSNDYAQLMADFPDLIATIPTS
ncbi:MAG: hypothetical protein KBC64_05615 [Simkaniaceae bacterium]|nr:hypothetical protein [Simkaniaceae bacterium]